MGDGKVDLELDFGHRVYYSMFKILFAIFVPGPTAPGIGVITKLDVAHQASAATLGLNA